MNVVLIYRRIKINMGKILACELYLVVLKLTYKLTLIV